MIYLHSEEEKSIENLKLSSILRFLYSNNFWLSLRKAIVITERKRIMYESFYNYLVSAGYKEYTPSGRKGTVYSYCYAIEKVLENEGISWEELRKNIKQIIVKYDQGGIYEDFGNRSNRTVINALRSFEKFSEI